MMGAFSKAFAQLSDPSFRRVLWIAVLGSIVIFIISWLVLAFVLKSVDLPKIDLWVYDLDLNDLKEVLGGVAVLLLTWILFPVTVTLIVGFFLEDVADAVDAKHYPGLEPARSQSILEMLWVTVKFLVVALVVNILALPILVPLLFTPLSPFVFYPLNGYLLGREYYELVAHRRLDPRAAKDLRKARSGGVFTAGVGIAILLTIPVLNLLAPIVATAAMVHLVERWRASAAV